MKKIPSIFIRDQQTKLLTDEVNPECLWVFAGEGVATIKYDGSAVMVKGGKYFKRYDAKHGKTPPPDFIPAQDPDPVTGHWPGWLPVDAQNPNDKWHMEGLCNVPVEELMRDATYELVGPKVQANPYHLTRHELWRHGQEEVTFTRAGYAEMKIWFLDNAPIEGIVFHHPDGRMAKIKSRDFGIEWRAKEGK